MTSQKSDTSTSGNTRLSQDEFNDLAIARIKSLLANPDISKSQKRTLLNILKKMEHQGS